MAPQIKVIDSHALQLLIQQGKTADQAAKGMSASRRVVLRTARAMGTPFIKSKKAVFTFQEENLLKGYYHQGLNDYDVARKMHVSRSRLRAWRNENSIKSQTNKKGLTSNICVDISRKLLMGNTLTSIGAHYGVRRTSIARLLNVNQIDYPKYRPSPPDWASSYHLTDYQTQFLIGDLFGDGGLCSTSESSAYFHAGHSMSQEPFIRWRYEVYAPLISNIHVDKGSESINIKTWTCRDLGYWYKIFYGTGKKILTPPMVAHLTPLSLAAWYMGDGSISRHTPYYHVGLQIDLLPIAKALTDKFGFLFDARKHEKEWHLWIRDRNSFFNLISPHIIPYFGYKIHEKYRYLVASKLDSKAITVITGQEYRCLDDDAKKDVRDSFCKYFMMRGLTYPHMNLRDVKKALISFRNGVSCKWPTKDVCEYYAPYRFNDNKVGASPMKIWIDKSSMKIFVERLLNNISEQLCDKDVWHVLENKGVPSVEDPIGFAEICRDILPQGGRVLDASVGYGERLIGCSSCCGVSYTGIDPREKGFASLGDLADICRTLYGNSVELVKGCFEDYTIEDDENFDLIFVDLPIYGGYSYGCGKEKPLHRYTDFNSWLNDFWIPSLYKCLNHTSSKGVVYVKVVGAHKLIMSQSIIDIFSKEFRCLKDGDWLKFIRGLYADSY